MTDVHMRQTPHSLLLSEPNFSIDCDGALVRVALDGPAVVVTVSGEIDSVNADSLGQYVHRFVDDRHPLILNLTDVGFLAVQGLRALLMLGEECAKAGAKWVVVASSSLTRLLGALGLENAVPTATSVADAAQDFRAT